MAGTAATRRLAGRPVGPRLRAAARWGVRALALATGLIVLAFLTNPEPTADLLGVGLPVTLPITQPDFGHSALSYLVGMWLFEFAFPLALLAAYVRWGTDRRRERLLLVGVPAAYMTALTGYCATVYVPNVTPTPLGPAATAVCWAFCGTGAAVWGALALAIAALGLLAWLATAREWRASGWATLAFGVLSLPLGLPALYLGYRRIAG